jgi:predicted dehydrogenase
MITRREVLGGMAASIAGAAIASTARSYAQIMGSNDRVNFAINGLNGRGFAHLSSLKANEKSSRITHICDVDTKIMEKFSGVAQKTLGYSPATQTDIRKLLESKDIDVVTVAVPDHWHTPMAVLGLKAGKHVYVEKPSSHNPREGELLVEAQEKYKKFVQVGDQQRSSPHTIEIIKRIHEGGIGKAYYAKAWYVNTRKSIGIGKPAPVPASLNWDLWQGPAPRSEFKDNLQPYNWHWFRRYGTGEALNNGTHEIDVCRWALQVDYPERVSATGGRYAFQDDWQFPDIMNVGLEYPGKSIAWEGRCCNGMKYYDRERGSSILGTEGSVLVDRDGYEVYDLKGKKTDEFKTGGRTSTSDLLGSDSMTDAHFANLIGAIRNGDKLNSPIQVGNVTVTTLLLANIAWISNRELKLDTKNGHVVNDPEAMKMWGREYEKGWEVRV